MKLRGRFIEVFCSLFVMLASCNRAANNEYVSPKFASNIAIELELVSDDIGFNAVNDFYVYKDYLIIVAYDARSGKFLHVYDKLTGKSINSGIFRGRGPGEIISGAMNTSFNTDTGIVEMWDDDKCSWLYIDIDKFVENMMHDAVSEFYSGFSSHWVSRRIPLNGGRTLNIYNPSYVQDIALFDRMTITDETNDILGSLKEFPDMEPEERWNVYNSVEISLSEDNTTLVTGTSYGAILEIFSLDGDAVSCEYTGKFAPCALTEGKSGIDATNTCYGFADIEIVDKKIVAVYHGGRYVKDEPFLTDLAIWSLKGKALKKIETNYKLKRLAYDYDNDMLYLVVSDDSGTYIARSEDVL